MPANFITFVTGFALAAIWGRVTSRKRRAAMNTEMEKMKQKHEEEVQRADTEKAARIEIQTTAQRAIALGQEAVKRHKQLCSDLAQMTAIAGMCLTETAHLDFRHTISAQRGDANAKSMIPILEELLLNKDKIIEKFESTEARAQSKASVAQMVEMIERKTT